MVSDVLDQIAAIPISGYERYLPDLAPGGKLGLLINEDHQIHRLGNERLLRGARSLCHQAFEPDQTTEGVVRVHGCSAAWMSGVPGFEHGMRFGAADLTNDDARRLQPHAGAETIEHGHVANRPQVNIILNGALQLSCVLD